MTSSVGRRHPHIAKFCWPRNRRSSPLVTNPASEPLPTASSISSSANRVFPRPPPPVSTRMEIGRSLSDEIDSPTYRGRPLTLVGHSQGGLVILSYLAELLGKGEGSCLRDLRQSVLLATPCEGSTTGFNLRRLASTLFSNPQELTLRVLNPDIADIRDVIDKRVVAATADSDTAWRVPIHAFCGMQDNVVPAASARGPFESVRRVPGTHFSILTPDDANDRRYTEFAEVLLDPGGHLHRFEIDSYETMIRVEPSAHLAVTCPGKNPRVVEYDNYGTLRRTVRFAGSNRCRTSRNKSGA